MENVNRPLRGKKNAGIIGLALVALSLLEWSSVENWRARRAWQTYAATQKQHGRDLDWEACIPDSVPDSNNFALNPYLQPTLDFLPGTQELKTPQSETPFMRTMAAAVALAKSKGIDYPPTSPTNRWWWQLGRTADMRVLLEDKVPFTALAGQLQTDERDWPEQVKAARLIREFQRPHLDPMLDDLLTASRTMACRFPLRYDWVPTWGISLNHLNTLKSLADQASRRAQARLALDEIPQAFADLQLVIYLGDTVRGEPFFVSDGVRLACRHYATQVIYDGLTRHQWTPENLQTLSTRLLQDDFLADARRTLNGTLAADLHMIDQARTGQNGYSLDDLFNEEITNSQSLFAPLHWITPEGWIDLEKIELAKAYETRLITLAATAETSLAERYRYWKKLPEIDEWQLLLDLKSHRLLTRVFYLHPRYVKRVIQSLVMNNQIIIACALERYFLAKGDYPDSLAAITPKWLARVPDDPMSGQPFLYRKTGTHHYLLYSVGANGLDEGGYISISREGYPDLEKGDWTWQL